MGFVSAATHMTIYVAPLSRTLAREWQPVQASALAIPVGHFSIVLRRQDGTRQWAYYGQPLYTYQHDNAPGEVAGIMAGERDVKPALASRDFFPAGIEVRQYPGRGPLMTTHQGRTLYTVARFHATYGGLESLGGYRISYNELKSQGTIGCRARCIQTWRPVLASRDAQPSGFWEIIQRPEGTRQWMFKGTPVYTYIGDRKPGDIDGNNRYVIAYGGADGNPSYVDATSDPRTPQPLIGELTMAAAVGAKPGEQAVYVAGRGYFSQTSDGGGRGVEATAARGAARFPDHGAGFYWHAIQPF
jgi:predicted lipoprotein with Yx(FWY)xxD motif